MILGMDDGRVELWDLSKKPLDPVCVHYPNNGNTPRTCVRFGTRDPVLVAGDAEAKVTVMRMWNTDVPYFSSQEQQDRLLDAVCPKR